MKKCRDNLTVEFPIRLSYSVCSFIFVGIVLFSACESEESRIIRLAQEEKQRIEIEAARKAAELEQIEVERERQIQIEQERKEKEKREADDRREREARLEQERKERELYDRYKNNSLSTGSTPYSQCFGSANYCSDWSCSEIRVKTPYNADVLVTIKRGGEVVRHAYIRSGSSYTFSLPDGTYQPFFYYGKGWNPERVMKKNSYCTLRGGFISNEVFGKDSPQYLSGTILEYELILQQNGNFRTRPSNANEAF